MADSSKLEELVTRRLRGEPCPAHVDLIFVFRRVLSARLALTAEVETSAFVISISPSDAISIVDATVVAGALKQALNDTVGVTDLFAVSFNFNRKISDILSISDSISITKNSATTTNVPISDTIAISDAIAMTHNLTLVDSVSFADSSLVQKFSSVPIPTGITPSAGGFDGAYPVTITGSHFTGATSVIFSSGSVPFSSWVSLDSLVVVNDSQITGQMPHMIPAYLGIPFDLTVTSPSGPGVLPAAFTYRGPTSISPTSGPTIGGTVVNIPGVGLTAAPSVTLGGNAASYSVINPSLIQATAPAHALGTVSLTVGVQPVGTGSLFNSYTYRATVPNDISGLALWLDAADAPTVHFSSGVTISQWDDKSGNARNVTPSGFFPPTYVTGFAPGPQVELGAAQALATTSFASSGAYTLFAVLNIQSVGPGSNVFDNPWFSHESAVFNGFLFGSMLHLSDFGGRFQDHALRHVSHLTQEGPLLSPSHARIAYRGGTGGSFTPEFFLGGSLMTTFATDAFNANTAGTAAGLAVYGPPPSGSGVNLVCELIYYDRKLTESERTAVETYLSSKWGV